MSCLFFRSLLVFLGLLWGAGAAGQGRGFEVVVSAVLENSDAIKLDTASRQIELHSWFPTLNIAYVSNVIDDTKYHNVDNLAAADMIAYPVLDVASVGLSFVGFDFIPEGLGVLYSAYRGDPSNTAIYSASMIFAFGSSPAFRLADELVAVKNLDAEDALYKRLNEVGESDEVLAYTASTSTAEVRSLTRSEANELSTKVLNYKDLKGTVVNLGSDLDNARLWLGSVSDGRAYVIVHSTGSEFKVLHNGQEVLLSHRSLARWIESKGLGSQEIVLLSCNDAATAQKLANKLPNAKIGSWSGEVRLFDNGFVEGDGSYKLYQKNTPPATITTPPNGGKTSKPQNGKMVRLGDEVVSGGRPANFLATLDKLHLTSLKSKLNQLDASTKAKFLDDFADASDDVLRQLDADLDLVDVWKGVYRSKKIDVLQSAKRLKNKSYNAVRTSNDGDLFEQDITKILEDKNISIISNQPIEPRQGIHNGGEIDIQTDKILFELTVGSSSKLSQIKKYVDYPSDFNPLNKKIVLYGPKYTNVAAKASIISLSNSNITTTVINEFDDFLKLFP